MRKAAGSNAATSAQDDIERMQASLFARQLFIGTTLALSWRLALTVLIPLIGGIQLDKKFDSSPQLTLVGLVLAFIFGSLAVWATVKEVNESQKTYEQNKEK